MKLKSWKTGIRRFLFNRKRFLRDQKGAVVVEYLLLLTLIGIGIIAGLAVVRAALTNELLELAGAINAIKP